MGRAMWIEMLPYWAFESFFISNGITTVVFLVTLLVFRYLAVMTIRDLKMSWTSEQRLRWIGVTKRAFLWLMLLGLVYIWSEEVQLLAVSIFAVALAVVVAFKEMLLCFNGSFTRMRGQAYELGDRIEMEGVRGDVIAINLLTTKLMEVGPGEKGQNHTGRSISFPNSHLLTNFVVNESFLKDFFLHSIDFPLSVQDDWRRAQEILLKIASEECKSYLERARKRIEQLEQERSLELPAMDPRVVIKMTKPGEILLTLRIPTPSHFRGRVEQSIVRKFLDEFY